ncbi:GNAT family N-acetyltransferase [Streptomyces termitum]|uniref:N-acetyltransferase n=1 Tax=Streptomyces termitum TaxID=67368 RepID=A0A918STM1_9ACTN|nr:GNAT family N-acetyltransferase [Streptomyces termitum]GHA68232.1 N-acetyltransferase [Streptomyces termitum]
MSEITIRRATAADSRRLTRLVRRSGAYRGPYAVMVDGYQVGGAYIEHHPVFAATDADGRVLGFYALLLDEAELDLAFVADDAQGLGIGRLLVAHMKDRARAAGLDSVRVVAHPPAEPFYLRTGARRTGTVAAAGRIHWDRPELTYDLTTASADGPSAASAGAPGIAADGTAADDSAAAAA